MATVPESPLAGGASSRGRVLVLGARGQLGREVVLIAGERGLHVVAWDRDELDLTDIGAIGGTLRAIEFDVLVNCAAYTAVDAAESNPALAFSLNAYAVEQIALACREADRMFVHVSTDYVFDGESETPYRPDQAPGPINIYGASKLTGEALARRAHREGTIVVRTSSVFGIAGAAPGGSGNFVETMLRLGKERERLRVVDDTVMAPTYAVDLARGIMDLLASGAPAEIYHVTNEGRASWHDFAREILQRAGIDTPVDAIASTDYPTPARRPRFSVLHTGRTTDRIGPLPPWRDALDRYLSERRASP